MSYSKYLSRVKGGTRSNLRSDQESLIFQIDREKELEERAKMTEEDSQFLPVPNIYWIQLYNIQYGIC